MPCASSAHQVLAGIYFTVIRPVRARRTRMCTHARPHRDAAGQEGETSHIVTYLPPSHTVTASHTAAVTYRHILFHAVLCRCIRFLMSCFARAALRSTKKLLAGFLRRTGAWVTWMLLSGSYRANSTDLVGILEGEAPIKTQRGNCRGAGLGLDLDIDAIYIYIFFPPPQHKAHAVSRGESMLILPCIPI